MQVYKINPIGFASNSYIVTEDGADAVVIDCAQPRVFKECQRLGLNPVAVLLTHGHYDHIGGCGEFYRAGVPIYCGEGEDELIFAEGEHSGFSGSDIPDFRIAGTFKDGERITLAGMEFTVMSTPGHTASEVCYITGRTIFSGDTLFYESTGRTDLYTGNEEREFESVKRLCDLEGDYTVYCGHGSDTTLDHERKCNPFIKR